MSDKRIIVIAGPNGAGLRYFESLYKPIVDDWILLDNSGESPILVEWGEKT